MLIRAIQVFITLVLLMGLYQGASRLDVYLFPVYSDTRLVSVEPVPGKTNVSLVHVKFKKARDCDYIQGQWFLGVPGASIGVATEWAEMPPIVITTDEIGDSFRFVNMSPDNVIRNSYVVATHDCYKGWLWNTQTVIRLDKLINDYEAISGETSVIPRQEP